MWTQLALQTDLYQLTMVGGYVHEGKKDQWATFDYFFRSIPDDGGYCVLAGLADVIEYIRRLRFNKKDLSYLDGLGIFSDEVLEYLDNFKFTGDLCAIPEGTVVFPHEPLIRVTAPLPEAQIIESALLNIMNFQTLIATKGARVNWAAHGDPVMDFGLRRAHGPDGALMASRAAYVGGVDATSNVLAGRIYGIPVRGTHAHSWVESFPSELEAFRAYAKVYPDACLLLADTYDTLQSGVPNAIQVGRELRKKGHELLGIRLDSGDLAYLSKEARKMLDEAGFPDAAIVASSDLDELIIESLKRQGSRINIWGVGTRLVTSFSYPALGGVYKLTALDDGKGMEPKIKRSDNPEKITNPGLKKVARIYDQRGRMRGDVLFLDEEEIPMGRSFRAYHPLFSHVFKTYPKRFKIRELMMPIFQEGELVYKSPSVKAIRENTMKNLKQLDAAYKRFRNPHTYHVSLSPSLFKIKQRLLREAARRK
ncbi:MAG: nicotinate phosphoribosyltransferase [Deltaproteobacteria bacterium]|nr:nicotinate phosphoribosyltransferase [Deltaproteobacteria bacterium]MBW2116364.1 nicotinate phosphoribosyltransferase [Deltaproteobacteria bacterium]MBW2342417.1 nicotinate phosphoribosyltransferase [Deltaproteobacteria bacterium]